MTAITENLNSDKKWGKYIGIFVLIFIVFMIMSKMVETVPAGHVKVATLFGKLKKTYSEGFHIVHPLYSFESYDVRQKTYKMEKLLVPSQDQLITTFDVSVQYRVNREMAGKILMETGGLSQLVNVHMVPKFRQPRLYPASSH